ncbi:flagellar hook-length control protein FliK [Magnetovirga frankeli]|uniref:flagellar hook-length control protein FliK n=1 Tax=Magnetovirga frankeli TaxID=947516 RepID=UPI001292CF05|nr:flagellar hook-length control protein FliK [gamma proteobacterium SS-5]
MELQTLQLALSLSAGPRMPPPEMGSAQTQARPLAEGDLPPQLRDRLWSRQTQALTEMLTYLKPARLSSELLLRLLEPFHAKLDAGQNPTQTQAQTQNDTQNALHRLTPETQRFLLRMSLMSLGGTEATDKTPLGKLMEMIGDKNAINLNQASLLAKATAAAPGISALSRMMEIGQILNARVVQQDANGVLRLQLGEQILKANLPSLPRLNPGDSLSLQLLSLNNRPQLKVISFASQSAPENQLLRQLLHQQGSLQRLFQQLSIPAQNATPAQSATPAPLTPAQAQTLPQGPATGGTASTPASTLNSLLQALAGQAGPSASPAPAPVGTAQPLMQQLAGTDVAQNLKPLIELLANHQLDPDRISEGQVRSLILNSGLFLEANLARKRSAPADLKSALLRMVAQLRSGPDLHTSNLAALMYNRLLQQGEKRPQALPERQQQLLNQLRSSVEGALAKVEVRQLRSLQQSDENRQTWQLALPLLDQQKIKDLEIRIQRDKQRKQQEQGEDWTVNLHFDFDSSGPMDVRINLKQDKIAVVFWAQWQDTLHRLGELMPKLEQSLRKAGLEVAQLSAYPGAIPEPSQDQPNPEDSLLRVTA